MISPKSSVGRDVVEYCAKVGADPLVVQGAGGNVSWKENGTLWIKASGTWLSNAANEEIFVPVDLTSLISEIAKRNFSAVPKVMARVKLRPSIETMLHALMPHPIVIHLHPVEILAHLVRRDFDSYIKRVIDKQHCFSVVDYCKPGPDLASAIHDILSKCPSTDVIFLKNHGVVIGGMNVVDVHKKLCSISESLITQSIIRESDIPILTERPVACPAEYVALDDPFIQQLALQPMLCNRLHFDWALYPDHVVFLGPRAHIYESWSRLQHEAIHSGTSPELVFMRGHGVFVQKTFTRAKHVQLRCYSEVMARQRPNSSLNVLTYTQIAELLNWDAEQYRISIAADPL